MSNIEPFKHTLFINLEHRKDRLEHINTQFKILGISGERINAVKMKQGAIGCTLSHIKCIELAKERNWEYVFICEDDITFTNSKLLLKNLNKFWKNDDIKWDVLIIGGNNCPPYETVSYYCIKVSSCQTTTGYIVKRHYYDVLIENFRESVKNLLKEPTNKSMYALDMYWKRLQRKDNWYMIIPVTVIQKEDYSDIEGRFVKYDKLMLDIDKKWLFGI
jgi:GR25 family glycosyltransferase involved in LPS biosynthesis